MSDAAFGSSNLHNSSSSRVADCKGPELKYVDETHFDGVVTTTGVIHSVVTIPQAATGVGHLGRQSNVVSLSLRGTLWLNASSAATAPTVSVRMIVFVDRQTNGVLATPAQLLSTVWVQSFLNLDNSERFHVLYDRVVALGHDCGAYNGTTHVWGENSWPINLDFKDLCIPITFDAATGDVGDQTENSVVVLFISNIASLASVQYRTRVRYFDA